MGFIIVLIMGAGLFLVYRWARVTGGRGPSSSGDSGASDYPLSGTSCGSDDSPDRHTGGCTDAAGSDTDASGDAGGCDGGGGGD